MMTMLSSILCKSLQFNSNPLHAQQLIVNDLQYQYFQKASSLQATLSNNKLQLTQQSGHIFLYTEQVQSTQIHLEMNNVNVFAVFGFTSRSQNISSSTINVSMQFNVVQAALICVQCDLAVFQSNLIFQAAGDTVSGVILFSKTIFKMKNSNVQVRFRSQKSSGLINEIQDQMSNFTLWDVNILCYNSKQSPENGYLASAVRVPTNILTTNTQVCRDANTNRVGFRVGSASQLSPSTEALNCMSICESGSNFVYGICLSDLSLGEYKANNDTYVCVSPFEFNGEACECGKGYSLNVTKCVNVVGQLTNLTSWLTGNVTEIMSQTSQNAALDLKLKQLDTNIAGNSSFLLGELQSDYDTLEAHLELNTSRLNAKIDAQTATLTAKIQADAADLLANIVQNSSALDGRIAGNATALNSRIDSLDASVSSQVAGIYTNITAVNSSVSTVASDLGSNVSSFNAKIADLNAHLLSNVTAVNSSVADLKTSTTANITQVNASLLSLTNQLQTNVSAVNTTLLSVNATLSSDISLLNASMLARDANIISNLTAINSTVSTMHAALLSDISSVNANLLSNASDLLSKIVSNSSALDGRIAGNATALNSRIDSLDASVSSQVADIYTNITAVNSSVSTVASDLGSNVSSFNTKIADLNAHLLSNVTAVNSSVADLKTSTTANITQLNASLLSLTNQLQTNVSAVNTTMLSVNTTLSSDISLLNASMLARDANAISNLTAINSTVSTMHAALLSDISSVNANLLSNASDLLSKIVSNSSALDGRIAGNTTALNSRIDSLDASVSSQVAGIYTNITAVNSSVSTVASDLGSNVSSFNAKIADLNAHLLSNVTAVNSSIADLKTSTTANITQVNASLLSLTNQLQTNVSAVNTTLLSVNATLSSDISLLNASMLARDANIISNLTAINSTVSTMHAALLSDISSVNANLLSNASDLLSKIVSNSSALDGRIAGNATALNSRIDSLDASVSSQVADIYTNITAVNISVSTVASDLGSNVSSFNTKIADLNAHLLSNVTAVNSSIADLKTSTTANITQVNASLLSLTNQLQTNVSAVNTTLLSVNATLSSDISLLNASMLARDANIISNLTAINSTVATIIPTIIPIIQSINSSMLQKTSDLALNISDINNNITLTNTRIDKLIIQLLDVQNQVVDLNQAELEPQFDFVDTTIDMVCNQLTFIQSFDIPAITNSIAASNFSSNVVFGAGVNLNNAFIDVADSSLSTTLFYLFQSQTYFYNLKIQVGTQVVGSGSIVADQGVQMVNRLTIVSKVASTITVQSGQQLNFLARATSGVSIRSLLVNVNLAPASSGSVCLIGTATRALNVRNYQVAGSYYSAQSSCLGVLSVNGGQVSLQTVNFGPLRVTFGNFSSYLFASVNQSSLQLQKIVVQVGASDASANAITSISTTAATDFAFGGVITCINNSQVDFQISTFRVFAAYNTQFVNNSGQMFGMLNKSNVVSVSQVCYQDSSRFQAASAVVVGIIGQVEGVFSFSNSNIIFSLAGDVNFQGIGTVALMTSSCTKAVIADLNVQVQVVVKTTQYDEGNVSALIGTQAGLNWSVQNSVFNNVQLNRGKNMGAVSGFCDGCVGTIQNVQVINSTLAATGYVVATTGSMIGQVSSSTVSVYSTLVNNITLSPSGTDSCYSGLLLGYVSQSQIQTQEVSVYNSSSVARAKNIQVCSGLIAFVQTSTINVNYITFSNDTMQVISVPSTTGNLYSGYIAGQIVSSTNVLIQNINIMNSTQFANCISGNAQISFIVSNINTNSGVTIQQVQVYNITLASTSSAGSSLSGVIVSIASSSQIIISQVLSQDVTINGQGSLKSQIGGIIALLLQSNMTLSNYQAFNQDFYLQTGVGNVSIGSAIGLSQNSNSTIYDCSIEQINYTGKAQEQNMVGGYVGSIISSNLTQSNSVIANSTAFAQSVGGETNVGGFFGFSEFSATIFYNCTVTSISVSSSSTTSRSVLFGGKVETSNCTATSIMIVNSNATTPVSAQPRAGGLFGRVYYSIVNATSIQLENIILVAQGTTYDSYCAGISTSLGYSTLNLVSSTLKNINIRVTSQTNNALASTLLGTHIKSTLNVSDVMIDYIYIYASSTLSNAVGFSLGTFISVVSASLENSGTDKNYLYLTHFTVGSVQITYSSQVQQIGLMDGKSDLSTYYYITDSQSVGLYTVQGTTYANCSPLSYLTDGNGKQYTNRRGC
ncbi:BspA_family leucine-rich repeat surface protein [Hexamita inflata]|uniref:BspA family leucine-rich repeat surface protein n=1 Tax=Hexamita inflata TaxID=28002 RepID=A0AA86TRM8_9EUKA|nr:BspA family leucine-rich repeat surface protein [Hexamita inflata]